MTAQHGEKFSLISYANGRRENQHISAERKKEGNRSPEQQRFTRIVEEIRQYLVSYRGRNEEDRLQYNEMLNRAVIGFAEEREKLLAMIQDQLMKKRIHDLPLHHGQFKSLAEAVFAEVIGLNVLEIILKNRENLEEIQVVGTTIFEVRNGQACLSPHRFSSLKEVERIQQNLVLFNNDTMNRKKRWAEAMLSDGSRVTLTGFGFTQEPTLTIRFYTVRQFRLEALCRPEFATISEMMKEILLVIIRSYFNIVIIGATNTGKTQLMKSMIAEMPDNERIVTIESRFELMLKRDFPEKNIIEYEVDESDVFHSSRQAFKLALRQSPKRIIHAEIRDEDANIYVRACTRGHEGSMTTVHVNELEDAPEAITDMCMLDQRGMNPERLVKRITDYVTQIGIEMAVVQGQRKVVRIAEFSYVQGEVRAQDIVRYDYLQHQWKLAGKFSAKAAHRIQKHDPQGYAKLKALHIV